MDELTPASAQLWENETAYQIADYNVPSSWLESQGEGVVVAVIDSGCDVNHIDLIGNLLPGKNFLNHIYDPEGIQMVDDNGHGTFVTGIVCAKHNGIGTHGVAPKAAVRPYKVLDQFGAGSYKNIIAGMHRAIEDNVDVINLSLYMPDDVPQMREVVRLAYSRNIPVVCAAGNFGRDQTGGDVVFPAVYPETIAVGAIDIEQQKADFSNIGVNLDFVAPGVSIRSTFPGNEYRTSSGTSFSCPWIAGVIALMISKHRRYGGRTPVDTVEQIREHLQWASVDMGDEGKDIKYGFGIIDVKKAVGLKTAPGKRLPLPEGRKVFTSRPVSGNGSDSTKMGLGFDRLVNA